MSTKLNPYISFNSNTREAMTFYRSVFGGELTLSTFGESGVTGENIPAEGIMHAELKATDITIMAADSVTGMREYSIGTNISLSLSGDDEAELTAYFDKLADGGTIDQPLEKAPWGDTFGMLTDKYGLFWMINIAGVSE